MQVAQLEEGRVGQACMATSPRHTKFFLAPVFVLTGKFSLWRLTLIPVGGTGPLHSLVTLVCQLGITTMVTSPYPDYSFTI